MKKCPACNLTYTDDSYNFCLQDGTPLSNGPRFDPNAETLKLPTGNVPAGLAKIAKMEFEEEKGMLSRHITYPHLTGLPSEYIQRRINSILRKKLFPQDEEERDYENQTIEESVDFNLALLTPVTLSIHVSRYYEAARAAHPTHSYNGITLDLRSGYQYSYEDLFRPGSDYQYVIQDRIKSSLKKQETVGDSSEQREEFDFYVTKNHLVIINLFYQHVVNMIEARIRLSSIRNLIHPEGPLFPLLELT